MKICRRCIMNDISDKSIYFDDDGYCNYCTEQLQNIHNVYFPNKKGEEKLEELIKKIKESGKGKKYDCLMGISGGLDSSYLAYLGCQWKLRILSVHIDDGFDTDITKRNIENLIRKTGIELRTIKPDAIQFNSLSKAYMLAGVPNLAAPQDNILFAFLYDVARKERIKYFLSGGNFALESILQKDNVYNAMDVINIKDIHKKFGTEPIDKLKFITSYKKYFDSKVLNLSSARPLNYIDYNMQRAYEELKEFCDFKYYGGKHLENYLTAFVQLYWLPKKFNCDKRTSHLSSMIVSGQISREDALAKLSEPLYEEEYMINCIKVIKENFKISDEEFEKIMRSPVNSHYDYKTDKFADFLRKYVT